jgi:hypothetical protein
MRTGRLRQMLAWLSLVFAACSLVTISYVKIKFVFESGNNAAILVSVSLAAALFALVLGSIGLPRWPSVVALTIVAFVAYLMLFTRLYGLS